jgi:hypothetical protein
MKRGQTYSRSNSRGFRRFANRQSAISLAIFAPRRKQTCSRSDIDVCDEQSFLAVRLTGKECAVGSHNR